jgi:hypothetical protein
MTKKEKQFLADILNTVANRFPSLSDDDGGVVNSVMTDQFTDDEWAELNLRCTQWNRHDNTVKRAGYNDYFAVWMHYFACLLEDEE